jgi:hypothetical protein
VDLGKAAGMDDAKKGEINLHSPWKIRCAITVENLDICSKIVPRNVNGKSVSMTNVKTSIPNATIPLR